MGPAYKLLYIVFQDKKAVEIYFCSIGLFCIGGGPCIVTILDNESKQTAANVAVSHVIKSLPDSALLKEETIHEIGMKITYFVKRELSTVECCMCDFISEGDS